MTDLPELPFLLTHGSMVYWPVFGLAALLGPLAAWWVARSRARGRAAAARDQLGPPSGRLQPGADGEVAVLSGVLELDGAAGPLESGPGAAVARPAASAAFLRVGDARVALQGVLELRAGSRERWGVYTPVTLVPPGATPATHDPGGLRLAVHRLWLASGQPVRASGTLRILPPAGEQSYREGAPRHILEPADAGGRIPLAAERRPAVRLGPGPAACGLLLFAALFAGVSCAGARIAGGRAWDAAEQVPGDASDARIALRWGALAAALQFRREWSLSAVDWATSLSRVEDPEAKRELVLLSASYERYRTGSCREALSWIQRSASPRFVAELGEACADADSLRLAASARLALGELDRAADLAEQVARLDRSRTVDQLRLERDAYLLAGRLRPAAATVRELQARVGELYHPVDPDQDEATWREQFRGKIGCAADQLAARAGDAAARARLEAAAWSHGSPEQVRAPCAILLADLADGAQRLAIIDRLRAGPARAVWKELELLELEADPGRAATESAAFVPWPGEAVLAGRDLGRRPGALAWSALERLASVVDPPLPVRRARVNLAAPVAADASLLGDHAGALRWSDMLDRDWKVLATDEADVGGVLATEWLDRLALQRSFIQLRAGRPTTLPARPAATYRRSRPADHDWVELQGLLDYIERGDLTRLGTAGGSGTFVTSEYDLVFQGLKVAARGSGAELARWLKHNRSDAMAVALVGARRIGTGKPAMLAWLRRWDLAPPLVTTADRATDSASREKIAEALGAGDVAAEHRAVAERLRRGLLRRDTALVRQILLVE